MEESEKEEEAASRDEDPTTTNVKTTGIMSRSNAARQSSRTSSQRRSLLTHQTTLVTDRLAVHHRGKATRRDIDERYKQIRDHVPISPIVPRIPLVATTAMAIPVSPLMSATKISQDKASREKCQMKLDLPSVHNKPGRRRSNPRHPVKDMMSVTTRDSRRVHDVFQEETVKEDGATVNKTTVRNRSRRSITPNNLTVRDMVMAMQRSPLRASTHTVDKEPPVAGHGRERRLTTTGTLSSHGSADRVPTTTKAAREPSSSERQQSKTVEKVAGKNKVLKNETKPDEKATHPSNEEYDEEVPVIVIESNRYQEAYDFLDEELHGRFGTSKFGLAEQV